MADDQSLIIVGASARAAAFSALRAGLKPWCIDLFADADLRARCPVTRIDLADYPHRLPEMIAQAPPGPWMYTGGLENHPRLVESMARERVLWGIDGATLRQLRSPERLMDLFHPADIRLPETRMSPPPLGSGDWLEKPFAGSGGSGIRFWNGEATLARKRTYYQRFIEGRSLSAIYYSATDGKNLLSVTEQLVGATWLHAAPFQYCGSIGPVDLSQGYRSQFRRIGRALARAEGWLGLLGVDCVAHADDIYPVEVNPRFTASMEVRESARGVSLLSIHRLSFDRSTLCPVAFASPEKTIGKAILFARESFVFPADGPWRATLDSPHPVTEMPAFADIPATGTPIERGWPVLTFFAKGQTYDDVLAELKRIAAELNQLLFAPSGPC